MPAKVEIDVEQVRRLAQLQLTQPEIAAALGVGLRTVERRIRDDPEFREAIEQGRAKGQASLRRRMMEIAMREKGRDAGKMAIWLSKQYLGMRVRTGDIPQESGEQTRARLLARLRQLSGGSSDPEDTPEE